MERKMVQALLPGLLAAALAASPAFASDEPVVIFPQDFTKGFEDYASYWDQWAGNFSHDLTSELGALYLPRAAGKVVAGAPYSAEVITETRQMLADGNDITRRKTGAIYRDGEGRTRQESGTVEGKERTVYINDPVANTNIVLSPGSKRALTVAPRAMSYRYDTRDKQVVRVGQSEIRVEDGKVFVDGKAVEDNGRIEINRGGKQIVVDGKTIIVDGKPLGEGGGTRHVIVRSVETSDGKTLDEVNVPVVPVPPAPPVAPKAPAAARHGHAPRAVAPVPPVPPVPPLPALPGIDTLRFESTAKLGKGVTTSLGVKEFDGVKAEGKSTTWTIPAGKIGNRNPIIVMRESWYSPELQVTVFSRHNDPRTGESIYRLANIRRGEPSADLFRIPEDYKVRGRGPKAPQG
jgi:hypothetical protein